MTRTSYHDVAVNSQLISTLVFANAKAGYLMTHLLISIISHGNDILKHANCQKSNHTTCWIDTERQRITKTVRNLYI